MVGTCGWLIADAGGTCLTSAEITSEQTGIEDRFLYEQLLLENEEQVQTKQREEDLLNQQR